MITGWQSSIFCTLALVAAAAMLTGCETSGASSDEIPIFSDLFADAFDTTTPSEAAVGMFNVYDPDVRRESITLLAASDFGGEPPYLRGYRLLIDDPDPTVRAACLNALGRHGETADVSIIAPYLTRDPNPLVRWQAAVALQRIHRDDAVEPLLTALREDQSEDVRKASATALAQYPEAKVFDALVGALSDPSYSVIREAHRSLRTLTGQSLSADGAEWLAWAEERENLFAEKQVYHYPQYQPIPTLWDRMIFRTPESPEPRQPRGLEPDPLPEPDDAESTDEA